MFEGPEPTEVCCDCGQLAEYECLECGTPLCAQCWGDDSLCSTCIKEESDEYARRGHNGG